MKFLPQFNAAKVDIAAYRLELDKYMTEKLKLGGRVWLASFIELIIPHWSGASRATFEKLAREFGTAIPYGQQLSEKDRKSLGRECGSQSGLEIDAKAGTWFFKYHNTLRYLTYNEYNAAVVGEGGVIWGLRHPTPYHFQEMGAAAFDDFAKTVKLPSPSKSIRREKI